MALFRILAVAVEDNGLHVLPVLNEHLELLYVVTGASVVSVCTMRAIANSSSYCYCVYIWHRWYCHTMFFADFLERAHTHSSFHGDRVIFRVYIDEVA